jgi:co-chaperonin GroES (HSP10)
MIKPFNRRIIVSKPSVKVKEEGQSAFFVPPEVEEEFSKRKEFEVVKVVTKADDVTIPVKAGDEIVVLSHMLEKLELDDKTYFFVVENNVLGKL